jgi:MFS family permease
VRFAAERKRYYGWTLVVALGVITIVAYGTVQYFFGVLVVPIQAELGWSRGDLALAYSTALIVAGVLGFPIGRYVDRHGARSVIALGAVIAASALIALSRVDALWHWEALWGVGLGLAGAMTLYPVTFTVVANWFHRRRGSAMALLTVLGGLASPIFIPLAGWLVPRIGWRETLVVFGLVQLTVALPIALLMVRRHPEDMGLVPDGAREPEYVAPGPLTGMDLTAAIRGIPFWTLTLSSFIGLLASNVIFAHQVAHMIDRGVDPGVAANLAGLVGLASLPGRLLFNVLSDRFRAQTILAIGQSVLALGVVVLAFATTLPQLLAFVVIYGGAYGAGAPLLASVRAEHFGRRAFAAIGAAQGVPALIGAALGPIAAGWIYDRAGTYEPAFAIVAVLYLVSAAAMFLTPAPQAG